MNTKEKLYQLCKEIVEKRLNDINMDIADVQNSVNTETKNTSGDKHDTSRAMMQLEVEQKSKHLLETEKLKETLSKISPKSGSEIIALGSLVETSAAKYYLSVSIGKLEVDGELFFAISMLSPIGELLKGKKAGDSIQFNGNSIEIKKVS